MATVFNTIDKVAGDPQASAIVKIELLFDKADGAVARQIRDQYMIQGFYKTEVTDTGYWSCSLVSNYDIDPADNIYRVTETIIEVDEKPVSTIYYILVPTGATPTYWTGSIMASKPSWVTS